MEVRDNANNSIIARRFALYDPVSTVTTNPSNLFGVHITTASPETGYRWQSRTNGKSQMVDYYEICYAVVNDW